MSRAIKLSVRENVNHEPPSTRSKKRPASGRRKSPPAPPMHPDVQSQMWRLAILPRLDTDRPDFTVVDELLCTSPIVLMHGSRSFCLSDAQRELLRRFVERGGVILADSVRASEEFTDSFCRELAAMFPRQILKWIPADDPLLSTRFEGFNLRVVTRRERVVAGSQGKTETILREVEPELMGIRIGDRWGVVLSRFDLSCVLESRESLASPAYAREDAAKLAINAVLYALRE